MAARPHSLMPDTRSVASRIVVAGADIHSAGPVLRATLFHDDTPPPALSDRLRAAGIRNAVVIATCDRLEVAALDTDPESAGDRIRASLAAAAGLGREDAKAALFAHTGRAALDHLFAVAAALESEVPGEAEVLGQVRDAVARAGVEGTAGPDLARLFDAAVAAARRVRSETAIGESAVSMAAAGVHIAGEVLGRFESARALVIGGAEIGVLVAERLRDQGLRDIWVADTVASRADALAARLGAHLQPMDSLDAALEGADIVLAGLGGAARPTVMAPAVAAAIRARRYRPMFLLDAAVPSDIDPAVARLDEAFLFDLNDLEAIALAGRDRRAGEMAGARAIVSEEVERFIRDDAARGAAPLVAELRAHFEASREAVLAEHPDADAEEATRLLVNRLLHAPSTALRDLAARAGPSRPQGQPRPEAGFLARLFGLGGRSGGDGI